jgi:hypothetical protein
MTATVQWELYCDYLNCDERYVVIGGPSLAHARRAAKNDGWGRWSAGHQGDYCADHKALFVWKEGGW